jgi:hypothetical protein
MAFAFTVAFDSYITWPIIHLIMLTGTFAQVFCLIVLQPWRVNLSEWTFKGANLIVTLPYLRLSGVLHRESRAPRISQTPVAQLCLTSHLSPHRALPHLLRHSMNTLFPKYTVSSYLHCLLVMSFTWGAPFLQMPKFGAAINNHWLDDL